METCFLTWQQECVCYSMTYWPTRSRFSGQQKHLYTDVMLTGRLAHRYGSLNSKLKVGFITVHLFDV
jgi:hypothetical protein